MLTPEQRFKDKEMYLELLSKLNVDLTQFSKYLDSIDYFEKPLTAQNFRPYAGGLCEYALDLYNNLKFLCETYSNRISVNVILLYIILFIHSEKRREPIPHPIFDKR